MVFFKEPKAVMQTLVKHFTGHLRPLPVHTGSEGKAYAISSA